MYYYFIGYSLDPVKNIPKCVLCSYGSICPKCRNNKLCSR